jgi:hypothetical protein
MDRSDGKVNMDLYDEYQELCALWVELQLP